MGIGDIGSVLDSLEFNATSGKYPHIIHVSGDVYVIKHVEAPNSACLATVTIHPDGQIDNAIIDSYIYFHYGDVWTAHIVHIAGDVFAVGYEGPSNDGFIKTFTIASNGQISEPAIDTYEFNTTRGMYVDIIHISGNVFAICYTGSGYDGFVHTVSIADNGTITKSKLGGIEFDPVMCIMPHIIHVSGNTYAIVYEGDGDNGYLKTITIHPDGSVDGAVIDTYALSAYSDSGGIIHVSGNVFAIVFSGAGGDGWLYTLTINPNGQIDEPILDSYEFDAGQGTMPTIVNVVGSVYAIVYETGTTTKKGEVRTVSIAPNGTITTPYIDTLEYDSVQGAQPSAIHIGGNIFAIAYCGAGGRGWLKTIDIIAGGGGGGSLLLPFAKMLIG